MSMEIRALSDEDAAASWSLGSLAFGYQAEVMPDGWSPCAADRHVWGAFDATAGRLLAKAVDLEQAQWFGGRLVPTAGVAGVAVSAESRGGGLGRLVLTHLLAEARERGALISTLFNTTPWPYRRLGWEEVGALTKVAVPTMIFEGLRVPAGLRSRPATVEDVPAIQELYRSYARAGTGLMDRAGHRFRTDDPVAFLADWSGLSVVEDSSRVCGYAVWDRSPGYDASARLLVGDLIADSADAVTALLAVVGGWASVAPTTTFRQSGPNAVHLLAPTTVHSRVESRQPWMLRLVHAADAIAARGFSPYLTGATELTIVDSECPWNAGDFRLVVEGGDGRLEPGGPGGATFTPRALASWYAGTDSPDTLRRAGLLAGATAGDAFLLAATAGPIPELLDYF